jgi:hypothetical protein
VIRKPMTHFLTCTLRGEGVTNVVFLGFLVFRQSPASYAMTLGEGSLTDDDAGRMVQEQFPQRHEARCQSPTMHRTWNS